MKIELEPEETGELLALIVDRLSAETGLADADRAALKRWRSETMKPGSGPARELSAKVNADLERTLRDKEKSAVQRPDWR